jgi:type III secretory pathway component EscR
MKLDEYESVNKVAYYDLNRASRQSAKNRNTVYAVAEHLKGVKEEDYFILFNIYHHIVEEKGAFSSGKIVTTATKVPIPAYTAREVNKAFRSGVMWTAFAAILSHIVLAIIYILRA